MSHKVEGAITLEVEAEVRGVFQPGYPATGPSYASGGEPGCPDMIEDAEVTGVFLDRRARDRFGLPVFDPGVPGLHGTIPKYERVDLLATLPEDVRAQVLHAWTEALRHEVEEHLLEAADD